MTSDDFVLYARSLGHTVDVITGEDGQAYSVVCDVEAADGLVARASLRYCDTAQRYGSVCASSSDTHETTSCPDGQKQAFENNEERHRS